MINYIEKDCLWTSLSQNIDFETFSTNIPNGQSLIPENLLKTAEFLGLQFDKQIIPNWQLIESGALDLPLSDILKTVFLPSELMTFSIYLLTDDSFFSNQVLCIDNQNNITDELLKEYCSLEATDYIAYSKEQHKIAIIHHEGVVFYGFW